MKYCEKCMIEYRNEIQKCVDCNEELVEGYLNEIDRQVGGEKQIGAQRFKVYALRFFLLLSIILLIFSITQCVTRSLSWLVEVSFWFVVVLIFVFSWKKNEKSYAKILKKE